MDMSGDPREKRQYRRIFFSPEEKVMGKFALAGVDVIAFTTNVMDLSLGGLYFTLKRDKAVDIKVGDRLTLKELQTSISLQIIAEISLEVVRIQDYDFIEHIGFGCEFTNLADDVREKIRQLVDWGIQSHKT